MLDRLSNKILLGKNWTIGHYWQSSLIYVNLLCVEKFTYFFNVFETIGHSVNNISVVNYLHTGNKVLTLLKRQILLETDIFICL